MAEVRGNPSDARGIVVLMDQTLSTAQTHTGREYNVGTGINWVTVQWVFTRAAGGTTVDAYLQTSVDGGTTWMDIYNNAVATTSESKITVNGRAASTGVVNSDATLANDTANAGLLGTLFRVKAVVVGTYTGASSLKVSAVFT